MASKLKNNNMNKAIVCHALLGLLVGVIARTYFHGQQFDKLAGYVATSIEDGLVTLAVKFLHFFISKFLQFRYLPALQLLAPSTIMFALFWVAFTRSVSSIPSNPS